METKEKKVLVLSILGVILMITLISGITYAWFSANIDGSDTTINVTTATLGPLKYTGTEITAENILPGWISSDATLTVEGTVKGNIEAGYYCYIQNTGEVTDIEYRISRDGEENSTSGTWTSINNSKIVSGNITEENASDVYKIGIRFKETGLDQNNQQNKTLSVNISCANEITLANEILHDNPNVKVREEGTFNEIFTESNNGNTIYVASGQDNKDTYYFAGSVTNNYVKFGTNSAGQDLYWRIVRINEDNSVRLIYAGLSATDTAAFISTSQTYSINSNTYNMSYYVGYEYNTTQHGLGTNSGVKSVVDSWYANNLSEEDKYISKTAIYCNDRTVASEYTWSTNGTTFFYSAHKRLTGNFAPSDTTLYPFAGTTVTPSFACSENADKFTVSNTTGNGALENPIALITADEVAYAGGLFPVENTSYYITQNASSGVNYWWTMSPYRWSSGHGHAFYVGGSTLTGRLDINYVNVTNGVRPVTSLKSCVTWKSGDGTAENPYEVEISEECASLEN